MDETFQGMQDLRLDTEPEPVYQQDHDLSNPNLLKEHPYRNRRSPIIVEFADAREVTIVEMAQLMEAGMNLIKIRMSFNTYNDRIIITQRAERAVKICCERFGVANFPVATCCAVSASMVKSGILDNRENEVFLKEGATVALTNDLNFYDKCSAKVIFVDNRDLVHDFKAGWEISIADGTIILSCVEIINPKCISCVVTKSGMLGNLQTVSFRFKGEYSRRPLLTRRDMSVLDFAKEYKIDMLIVYYARNAETIQRIKQYMPRPNRPQIFAAICTQQGIDAIDDLLRECDGLVLARELLPWELSKESAFRMSSIQKWVSAKCQKAGKPLFISGGILSSLIQTGELTSNEIADVTNALFDGATGFMLKEVNDIKNAIQAVKFLNEICCAVEPLTFNRSEFRRLAVEIAMPANNAEASAVAAAMVANQIKARVIILPTVSGRSAKILLRLRPSALIITVSRNPKSTRYLFTLRNIIPLMYTGPGFRRWSKTVQYRINYALEFATSRGFLVNGDMYVTLQRSNDTVTYCDMVRIFPVVTGGRHKVECPSSYSFLRPEQEDTNVAEPVIEELKTENGDAKEDKIKKDKGTKKKVPVPEKVPKDGNGDKPEANETKDEQINDGDESITLVEKKIDVVDVE